MRTGLLLLLGVLAGLAVVVSGLADTSGPAFISPDLQGWDGLKQYWAFKEGALIGSAPEGLKFNTFLCSRRPYKNFELKFQVRLKDGVGNSGVQIRSAVFNLETFAVLGPQCDIGKGYWGSLYGEHFGGMMQASPKEIVERAVKNDDFNDYHITCQGNHVTIKLNGETTVDADFPKMPDIGLIGFQIHSGPPMEVTFRNLDFKELK